MSGRGDRLRALRESKGLALGMAASKVGISQPEYFDIEAYDDELLTVTPIRTLKSIARVLDADPLSLMELRCDYCAGPAAHIESPAMSRDTLVSEKRRGQGMTVAELGERIGFDEATIARMESEPDFLDGWPVSLVRELASVLGLPVQVLAGVKCRRCNR